MITQRLNFNLNRCPVLGNIEYIVQGKVVKSLRFITFEDSSLRIRHADSGIKLVVILAASANVTLVMSLGKSFFRELRVQCKEPRIQLQECPS
jgi:hypothetical protein